MAKGNANGAAVQYKVHLKPTDVGVRVMKRMERPHLDKSAELRRFIELGYAAEQAGFILDGTVLRHAGRMWDTQPDFGLQLQVHVEPAVVHPTNVSQRSRDGDSPKPEHESPGPDTVDGDPAPKSGKTAVAGSAAPSLRTRLRGISG